LLLERGHRLFHRDVVLDASIRTPDDQADRAHSLAVDENFTRPHHDGVGDGRVRDRNARHVERRFDDGGPAGRDGDPRQLFVRGLAVPVHGPKGDRHSQRAEDGRNHS